MACGLKEGQAAMTVTVEVLRQIPYFAELEAGLLQDLAGSPNTRSRP
ncbi:MAG: hypothetical protein HY347_08555 [candidate division NC10 bacterium]|nr:hypothetical protein [candidate division NC10 bacterium]